MFSPVRFLAFLLLSVGLVCARPAKASHAAGGSITYTSLGGNSYRVRVDYFQECSAMVMPVTAAVSCQTACATTAQTFPIGLVNTFIDTPYGSALQPQAVCPISVPAPATALLNFATYRYEGIVTLPPNQWKLFFEESARVWTANSTATTLRLEATLDNRTRVNNSVVFSNLSTVFIPVNQPNLLHVGAFDADGDSLSYSLERPLSGCGTYEYYSAYPTTNCTGRIDPRCPNQIIGCAGSTLGNYTQFLPIAVADDTLFENGSIVRPPCPATIVSVTKQPCFSFSQLQGAFSFTPNRYLPSPPANGDNKYTVVVKVTEWRKENGVYVVVGTTRRDMLWAVYNNSGNTLPRMGPTVTVQNGSQSTTQALTTPIPVHAGEPISVTFTATNPGSGFPMVFTLEQNTIPGAVIQAGATAGTGRLTFTPPLSLPTGTYRVSVSVTDDALPLRNLITVPVTFHVYRTALATRPATAQAIAAYPTPFTEQVQFQLPTPGVQHLTVCDQLGRVVAHLTSQADGQVQWVPGASVPAGLYSARSADGKLTVRLLRSTNQ